MTNPDDAPDDAREGTSEDARPTTEELQAGMAEAIARKEPHDHPDDSPVAGDQTRESETHGVVSQNGVNRRGGRAGGQPA